MFQHELLLVLLTPKVKRSMTETIRRVKMCARHGMKCATRHDGQKTRCKHLETEPKMRATAHHHKASRWKSDKMAGLSRLPTRETSHLKTEATKDSKHS